VLTIPVKNVFKPAAVYPKIMKFGLILSLVAILLMLTCAILVADIWLKILIFAAAAISIAAVLVSLKKKKKS